MTRTRYDGLEIPDPGPGHESRNRSHGNCICSERGVASVTNANAKQYTLLSEVEPKQAEALWHPRIPNLLAAGPVPQEAVKAKAKVASLAWRTVERAKEVLGVKSTREGWGPGSKCSWRLPEQGEPDGDGEG
jgi:hypothetical protein